MLKKLIGFFVIGTLLSFHVAFATALEGYRSCSLYVPLWSDSTYTLHDHRISSGAFMSAPSLMNLITSGGQSQTFVLRWNYKLIDYKSREAKFCYTYLSQGGGSGYLMVYMQCSPHLMGAKLTEHTCALFSDDKCSEGRTDIVCGPDT